MLPPAAEECHEPEFAADPPEAEECYEPLRGRRVLRTLLWPELIPDPRGAEEYYEALLGPET